jgi:hypothetical protein
MTKFHYEIQTPHAPGCVWLRSPHGRDTWERAFEEGQQYAKFHFDYANMICAVRVIAITEA